MTQYSSAMTEAMRNLYAQGGLPRFYRGIGPALVQARHGTAWQVLTVWQYTEDHRSMEKAENHRILPPKYSTEFYLEVLQFSLAVFLMPCDQGPLMRFVDSSANAGVLALFEATHAEKTWPAPWQRPIWRLCWVSGFSAPHHGSSWYNYGIRYKYVT